MKFAVIFFFSASSNAQTLPAPPQSQENQGALKQTQQVLANPELRKTALDTEKARTADRNAEITSLGNQDIKNSIYSVSSDLLPWLAEIGGGNPEEMQKLLLDAQTNPQALQQFYQRMPAAQKEQIKAISQQIEKIRGGSGGALPTRP
jgi:hypothetical protein